MSQGLTDTKHCHFCNGTGTFTYSGIYCLKFCHKVSTQQQHSMKRWIEMGFFFFLHNFRECKCLMNLWYTRWSYFGMSFCLYPFSVQTFPQNSNNNKHKFSFLLEMSNNIYPERPCRWPKIFQCIQLNMFTNKIYGLMSLTICLF